MRVRVVRSFSARLQGKSFQGHIGEEFELPAGVDWLQAGLVVPVRSKPVEHAVQRAPERAVTIDATPSARKLAESANLDLSGVAGSGSGGRITKTDVEKLMKESDET